MEGEGGGDVNNPRSLGGGGSIGPLEGVNVYHPLFTDDLDTPLGKQFRRRGIRNCPPTGNELEQSRDPLSGGLGAPPPHTTIAG